MTTFLETAFTVIMVLVVLVALPVMFMISTFVADGKGEAEPWRRENIRGPSGGSGFPDSPDPALPGEFTTAQRADG